MIALRPLLSGFLVVAAAVAAPFAVQAAFDAEHQSGPPRGRPAASGRALESFDPPMSVEAQLDEMFEAAKAAVEEADRVEAERIAQEEARLEAARRDAERRVAPTGSSAPSVAVECGNTLLPDDIIRRESGGRCDAYNPTGCGGRGCIGYAQIDQGHFWAVSPWNPNVPGGCYGLSYNECVAKLWAGGAGAGNWR